jgi:hypothetical protein
MCGELDKVNITKSRLKISNPHFTTAMAEVIPYELIADRTKEVDFRGCGLKSVPFHLGDLDDKLVSRIRLDGNPLVGFSRSFKNLSGGEIIRGIRKVRKDQQATWNEMRILVIGDAAVGYYFPFLLVTNRSSLTF